LRPRPRTAAVLSNLYQLYIHDFTDFVDKPLGNDGRFDYDPLPPYWSHPDCSPFLVWVDGKLAGIAGKEGLGLLR
jgi:predicted acetyltransferase